MKELKELCCTVSAVFAIICIFIAAGLGDNESLIPSAIFAGLSLFFVFIHKKLEVDE